MRFVRVFVLALAFVTPSVVRADDGVTYDAERPRGFAYLLVLDGTVRDTSGDWRTLKPLYAYAKEAPAGTYLLACHDGATYRIEDAALIRAVRAAYAPIAPLADQQGQLGELQGQLGREQGKLGEAMVNARSSAEQTALGERQSELGERQSKLGKRQGAIGKQMAALSLEADRETQAALAPCFARPDCARRVER